MSRDAVLASVRDALAGVTPPPLPAAETSDAMLAAADVDALVARFAAEARAVGTLVHEIGSRAQASALVAAFLAPGARVVVCPSPLAREVAVAAAAQARAELRVLEDDTPTAVVAAADVGITEADALVATSGTLVLGARGRRRTASLLPATHVVIVERTRVAPDLASALRRVGVPASAAAGPDACLTLITGPSRTADIEKKLVVGVHGPCVLHVVLVADDVED